MVRLMDMENEHFYLLIIDVLNTKYNYNNISIMVRL